MARRRRWVRVAQRAVVGVLAVVVLGLSATLVVRPPTGLPPGEQVAGGGPGPASTATPDATSPGPVAPSPQPATPLVRATAPPTASDLAGVPVAFIGDAVQRTASGTGAAAPDWTALVAQQLAALGRPVRRAVAGEEGAGWAARSPSGVTFASLVPRVVTPATRVVVVLGGLDDLGSSTPADVAAGARRVVAAVHAVAPGARVLVVPAPRVAGEDAQHAAVLAAQATSVQQAALDAGVSALDPRTQGWTLGPGATAGPTAALRVTPAGQLVLAQHVTPLLSPLVAAATPS